MARKLLYRLEDMKKAAEFAIRFYEDRKRAGSSLEFELCQSAIERQIEIFCEAATQIGKKYPEFTQIHPEIPWKNIYGMRILLSHEYHKIETAKILQIVKEQLPDLLGQIDQLITSAQTFDEVKPSL